MYTNLFPRGALFSASKVRTPRSGYLSCTLQCKNPTNHDHWRHVLSTTAANLLCPAPYLLSAARIWTCLIPALYSVTTSMSVNVKWDFTKVPISFFYFTSTTLRRQDQSETTAESFWKVHQWNVPVITANSTSSSHSQCFETSLSWQTFVKTQEKRKIQILSKCFYTSDIVRVRTVRCVVKLRFFSAGYVVLKECCLKGINQGLFCGGFCCFVFFL